MRAMADPRRETPNRPADARTDTVDHARAAAAERAGLRVVLARHEGAPTGDHLDLFVGADPEGGAIADPDAAVALTWRLALGVWRDGTFARGTHDAERLPPHRALYLALDAPRELDGGRGRVVPLAACRARGSIGEARVELRLANLALTLAPMDGSRWQLEVTAPREGGARAGTRA
jgi:hypothetical protein